MSVLSSILTRWGLKDSSAGCGSIPSVAPGTGVNELLGEDFVIIFKHSTACPVSWAAHTQVSRFLRENPGAPVRLVRVIQERPLSQQIAAATGVRHESPQILALRRGEVVAAVSHGNITAESLSQLLAPANAAK
jgi:bacillithiol system protein YtxJ